MSFLLRIGERRHAGPRPFAIGGLLGCGEALLLIGAPKSGKSAVAVAAARAVATGDSFFGRRVRRGLVVYVPAERFEETDLRLEIAFAGAETNLLRLAKSKIYGEPQAADRLAAEIRETAEGVGVAPTLVIFDTVAALLRDGAGDENSQRDASKLTDAIDKVRERTGASVIVVHHAKRGEKRSRGSEVFEAWADVVAVADGKGEQRRLSVVRSNTVEEGLKATFAITPVDLGEDPDTGARSAVVLATDAGQDTKPPIETIRLSPDVETAFSELKSFDHPVALTDWRIHVMATASFVRKNAGARRQAFLFAKKTLEDQGLIHIDDQTVSIRSASA